LWLFVLFGKIFLQHAYFDQKPQLEYFYHFSTSESSGRTLYRVCARDATGETEGVTLNETVPPWVLDIVVNKIMPKFAKIAFYLYPHPSYGLKYNTKRLGFRFKDFSRKGMI